MKNKIVLESCILERKVDIATQSTQFIALLPTTCCDKSWCCTVLGINFIQIQPEFGLLLHACTDPST